MRSRNRRLCGYSRCLGQTGSRFWEYLFCTVLGEPLLAYLSGDRAPKALAAKVGRKTTKRTENIGDNARGQGAMAWVDPTGYPTETQQKRTFYEFPLRAG